MITAADVQKNTGLDDERSARVADAMNETEIDPLDYAEGVEGFINDAAEQMLNENEKIRMDQIVPYLVTEFECQGDPDIRELLTYAFLSGLMVGKLR
jgi:hypothetical protein